MRCQISRVTTQFIRFHVRGRLLMLPKITISPDVKIKNLFGKKPVHYVVICEKICDWRLLIRVWLRTEHERFFVKLTFNFFNKHAAACLKTSSRFYFESCFKQAAAYHSRRPRISSWILPRDKVLYWISLSISLKL